MRVYDPIYGQIEVGGDFAPVVNSVFFRRLQHLRQLGLCYLSFPGGNHTRFEHSLGTFHLASQIEQIIYESDVLDISERARLLALVKLGALCHDLGHGPFSHMTENVLVGLGAKVSHEEVGAAITAHFLAGELRSFAAKGVTPSMVGRLITKSADDPLLRCAEELVSSDLDLDRLDFLHRDSHYAGKRVVQFDPRIDLRNVWRLHRYGRTIRFELTDDGVDYAERILFLRRNNYRRIVYEPRHMCMTAMFEKAVYEVAREEASEFGRMCREVVELNMDWADDQSVRQCFPRLWKLYGLVDYQALGLLDETSQLSVRRLVGKIRMGRSYDSIERLAWGDLHYVSKQLILGLQKEADAFAFRREFEEKLASSCPSVAPLQLACHLPRFSIPKPLRVGTERGMLLEEASALGRFLLDDVQHQYAIELFVDEAVSTQNRATVKELFRNMLCDGLIGAWRRSK